MKRVILNPFDLDVGILREAVSVLRDGGLVGFPTDTVYGVAGDPRNKTAVLKVYQVKSRPSNIAVPIIAADREQVMGCVRDVTPVATSLMAAFWPGPLSIVMKAAGILDRRILGEGDSVAMRVPGNIIARELAKEFGFPIMATSANMHGEPPGVTGKEVCEALGGKVDLVLDGGRAPGGLSSTVVDGRGNVPVLVRDGPVPWSSILSLLE